MLRGRERDLVVVMADGQPHDAAEIERITGLKASTVHAMLQRMERRRLVERPTPSVSAARVPRRVVREAFSLRDGRIDYERAWHALDPEDQAEIGAATLELMHGRQLPRNATADAISDVARVALPAIFGDEA